MRAAPTVPARSPFLRPDGVAGVVRALGGAGAQAADPVLCDFEARVATAPEQVVRYSTTWPRPAANGASVKEAVAAKGGGDGGGGGGGGGGGDGDGDGDGDGEGDDGDANEPEEDGISPGVPLWWSSSHRPLATDIPPCARCGAARVFELQVMPQTLHYVLPEGGAGAAAGMDFGTLCVYTCPKSCALDEGARCVEEVVWVQPP